MKTPTGKGMYVWLLDQNRVGTPQQMADTAKAAGIQWLAIKLQDGSWASDGYRTEKDFNENTPAYLTALRAADIDIWGWVYLYGGNNTRGEIAASLRALRAYSVSGWILDPEIEYKKDPDRAANASAYCNALKVAFPDLSMGLSSYRYPTYHQELPWKEFLARMDFHAPQLYWLQAEDPGNQLRRSYAELNKLRELPFVPAGCAFPYGSWQPTVSQLDEFYKVVTELGCPGWFWWEWYYAVQRPEWWKAISDHGKLEPVYTMEEQVRILWAAHPELHQS